MPGFDTTVQEIWLGKHGSPEAQQKYDQLIHEIRFKPSSTLTTTRRRPQATQEQPV